MKLSLTEWDSDLIKYCNAKAARSTDKIKKDVAAKVRVMNTFVKYGIYAMQSKRDKGVFRIGAIGVHREPDSKSGNTPLKRLGQCNRLDDENREEVPGSLNYEKKNKPWKYVYGATIVVPPGEKAPRFMTAIVEGMLQREFSKTLRVTYLGTSCFRCKSKKTVVE